MSALYKCEYQDWGRFAGGVFYIGRGRVLGMDLSNATYDGSYTADGDRLHGTVTLTSAGGALGTGRPIPAGTRIPIAFDWPTDFADGEFHPVTIGGQIVQIKWAKIGDVP